MIKDGVLITGCSSGLGAFLADKFEQMGHKVMRHNGKKHFDLRRVEDIEKLAKHAIDEDIKVLVNNAALGCPSIRFGDYTVTQINEMIDVNLRAPIILSHLLSGHVTNIININSMVGLEVKRPRTLYSATKWGLRGFSNSLKAESENINILDVYPTNIRTTPDRKNAMCPAGVVDSIYQSYTRKEQKLVLDGRLK
jgi:short-subunit dehydrogenase